MRSGRARPAVGASDGGLPNVEIESYGADRRSRRTSEAMKDSETPILRIWAGREAAGRRSRVRG
ncbi:hypothetical protein GCM10009733_007520 [Nonomuraea maheshkhaliensis]|uniref:Uncharacterized protein n=1 Tax=Nonomuraea maheshkhaliensis TaxID=419590 RepID=A0ABP4QNQ1_9ACTN